MALRLTSNDELLKKWSDDYLNGRWAALLDLDVPQEFPELQSLKARAQLMLGHLQEAKSYLEEEVSHNHQWLQINDWICKCHIRYIEGDYEGALFYANKAALFTKKKGPIELLADSGFYRGLCLTQLGEKYEALSLYHQLRKLKSLTPYRLNLILVNEAWLLWDLGLIQPLRNLAPLIPHPYNARIQLLLQILRGGPDILKLIEARLTYYTTLPANEKENLFINILEAYLVYGGAQDIKTLQKSLFYQDIIHNTRSTLVGCLVALLEDADHSISLEDRDLIDYLFIKVLILTQKKNSESIKQAQKIYFDELIPCMKSGSYHSPLIPSISACKNPHSAWERQITTKLYGLDESKVKIQIINETKSLIFNDKISNFKKSPTTWKLILALQSANRLSKEEIHKVLTHNRYRPDLHDTRIFKLVQRLSAKIQNDLNIKVCRFTGENELEVCCEFVRSQKHD